MHSRNNPSSDQYRELRKTLTGEEIACRYGVTQRTIQRWEKQHKEERQEPEIEFPDLHVPELHWREAIDIAVANQEFESKAATGQHTAKIVIKSDRPIVVVYSADWHLGSLATDYKSFIANMDYIFNTDGVYLGVVGDEIDNFTQFRSLSAVFSQVLKPEIQKDMLADLLADLIKHKKLLFTSWGNHNEGFDERVIGYSMKKYMYDNGVPHLNDDGRVDLTVGGQEYSILAKHLGKYNSSFNSTWTAKQLYRMDYPADMTVVAHTHNADFETYYHYDKQNFLFRVGTFKINDSYSRRYHGKPIMGTPAVVLSPDSREIVPFLRVDQAVRYMSVGV